jgi:serine protease Do
VDAELAKTLKLERPVGVLISRISANAPSARAGLRVGDVVFAIDGQEVADVEGLRARAATKGVGATATLTLIRNGAAINLPIALQAAPEIPARALTTLPNGTLFAGVQIGNLSPAFALELGVNQDRGVVVTAFSSGAPAARLGLLQPLDILEAINGRDVATVEQVRQALTAGGGRQLTYRLNRGGQRAECTFRAPSQFFCRQ